MPALQYQLMQMRIVGYLDQQSVQTPLWYYTNAASGIELRSAAELIASVVRNRLLPNVTEYYHCIGVYGSVLGGLQFRWNGTGVDRTLKTIRKLWSEKYFAEVEADGSKGQHPMPSYVAASAEKVLSGVYQLNGLTAIFNPALLGFKFKSGSMRIAGLTEDQTPQTEANLLTAAARNAFNTYCNHLVSNEVTDTTPNRADGDIGKVISMCVLSEKDGGEYRINKGETPENTSTWLTNFLVGDVSDSSFKVARELGSQVSRKRKRQAYA